MDLFTQAEVEAIAGSLGEATLGLTNLEIEFLLPSAKMTDPGKATKRRRLCNASFDIVDMARLQRRRRYLPPDA